MHRGPAYGGYCLDANSKSETKARRLCQKEFGQFRSDNYVLVENRTKTIHLTIEATFVSGRLSNLSLWAFFCREEQKLGVE
jgi:hypothetical protein